MNEIKSLLLDRYRNIVFLTGAGVSVASGLRPYRGPGGLWEEQGKAELAKAETLRERPEEVWSLFGELRTQAGRAEPNPAHRAIAELERRLGADRVTVITQNVDGLHARAGSTRVIEVHGSVFRSRCSNDSCDLPSFREEEAPRGVPPCDRCGSPLRPDIVLFQEAIPVDAEWSIKRALRECDCFIAAGTSGTVSPASNYVRAADYAGARTILVNLEAMDPPNPYFREEYLGPAEELLPLLLAGPG